MEFTEFQVLYRTVRFCVGMCQRSSDDGEKLWLAFNSDKAVSKEKKKKKEKKRAKIGE